MNLQDYLLQREDEDWATLLEDWTWLLPKSFVVWLVNRFGDLFIVQDDGTVWMLDTSAGTFERVADSRDHFANIADQSPDTFDNWFMTGAVDDMVEAGHRLEGNQCYSYRVPAGLGGDYRLENFMVTDLAVHLSIHGQIFGRTKDLADGTKINFQITE